MFADDDLVMYTGHENWDDEYADNYEIGAKTRLADGRVTFNASLFVTKVDGLQVIADAGSCSSRIIINADAETQGAEIELFVRPDENWDFGLSATYVKAEVTESPGGPRQSGRRHSRRQPHADIARAAGRGHGGVQLGIGGSMESYVRFTVQYVGSSFTQLADQEPNFGLITSRGVPGAARLIPFGGVTVTDIPFNAELPSYDIGNLRWGIRTDRWEGSAVRQQPVGRARVPVGGSRARPQRTRRVISPIRRAPMA